MEIDGSGLDKEGAEGVHRACGGIAWGDGKAGGCAQSAPSMRSVSWANTSCHANIHHQTLATDGPRKLFGAFDAQEWVKTNLKLVLLVCASPMVRD